MPAHWTDDLVRMDACDKAIEWAQVYPTLKAAWAACKRGDWMAWYLIKHTRSVPARKRLVLCLCECARNALKAAPAPVGELRPLRLIETAENWARGIGNISELKRAAQEVYDISIACDNRDFGRAAYFTYAALAQAYRCDVFAFVCISACPNIIRKHYPTPLEK